MNADHREEEAKKVLDGVIDMVIGVDLGTVDMSCEAVFEQQADGSLKMISAHHFYRTIDLEVVKD